MKALHLYHDMLVLDDLKELVDRRTSLDRSEDLLGRMSSITLFWQEPTSFPLFCGMIIAADVLTKVHYWFYYNRKLTDFQVKVNLL